MADIQILFLIMVIITCIFIIAWSCLYFMYSAAVNNNEELCKELLKVKRILEDQKKNENIKKGFDISGSCKSCYTRNDCVIKFKNPSVNVCSNYLPEASHVGKIS